MNILQSRSFKFGKARSLSLTFLTFCSLFLPQLPLFVLAGQVLAKPPTAGASQTETASPFEGFSKAKVEIDSESRGLLKKICAKEPIQPTQKELDKRRECEVVADRFIQRWHETLDLNILFDEMYVANPQQRRRNVAMFYGVYKFLSGSAGVEVEKGFTDEIFQDGFFTFWNLMYLDFEARLLFPNDAEYKRNVEFPPYIVKAEEALMKLGISDKTLTLRTTQKFIEVTKMKLAFLRKRCPPEVFDSASYKASLQEKARELQSNEYKKELRTIQGFEDFGVSDEVEVYYLNCGVFEFYFIEEAGKLKVLTLGFEL